MRVLLTLLCCGMCCLSAQAGNFTYITPPGSSVFGDPVDTKAVFSISNGMLDVTLENLQANPKDETQLLLGVNFYLRDGNLNHASLISSSGQEITVHSN